MKRLFISLYLLLSLSFLGIGWAIDNLWQKNTTDEDINAPLIALAQLMAQLPYSDRQTYLDKLDIHSNYPLQLLKKNKVILADGERLSSDEVLITAKDKEHELHFIKIDAHQVLMAGPIETHPRNNLKTLLTLLFYLSLALVALIWVWPLSRDLKTLKRATEEFGQSNWDTQIKLSPSSQVLPLASTFNEMARHIRELIESQKHLSNAVSHEIRTPLARLKFAIALLPQYCQPKSEQRREQFLQEMSQDIQEMEHLLQELLTYASLESQRNPIQVERCNLTKLTSETILRLQKLAPIPITFNSQNEQLEVIGDPALIERALQNLIINAQRFAKTKIYINLAQQGNMIELSVTDDGEGVDEIDQQKIFEPFYRSKSKQNGNKGHGLGLAIIKRIMKRHYGQVSLFSQNGVTRFTLSWPLITKKLQTSHLETKI